MNSENHNKENIHDYDILSSDELISFDCKKTAFSEEDCTVLAAQELLVSRHRGPGRAVDANGSFKEFSDKMAELRAKRRLIKIKQQ